MTDDGVVFEPPGKGEWRSLRDHFPRALTPEYAELLATAMYVGEAQVMEEYGMPVRSLVAGLSHGHVYIAPEPLVGKPSDSLPPRAVLWALARLLPAFRRRTRAAARCLAERPWLADAESWYHHEQPRWVQANRALQAENPTDLGVADLIDHLGRVRAHAAAGYERHFALHGPDMMPIGLLLARGEQWGLPPELVLAALTGASPVSTGRGPRLDALRAAVEASGARPSSPDEVRAVAGAELDAFLDEHGWRLVTGYDIDSLALVELPALVANLARPTRAAPAEVPAVAAEALERALERVAPADRSELARLVSDARATAGLRDDNGAVTAAWPAGLLRRAMLAAGRVLAERGGLAQVDHAVEVTVDELGAMLRGQSDLDAAAVEARASARSARSELVPPLQLGPTLDIPLDALPAPMRTVARALFALREVTTAPVGHRTGLDGDGLGQAVYRGRACVATDPADALGRLEPGDVLVAFGTTPAYNLALGIVGAVVVEEGGLLSHAAVIVRELGLTAVIGAAGAMEAIPDGALVEVDPVAGRVRVLAASP
jgi:phosphohistidine swiveling domain-containing protein